MTQSKTSPSATPTLWDDAPVTSALFIAGRSVSTIEHVAIVDPAAPEHTVGFAAAASADDVELAISSAWAARAAWRCMPVAERARLMKQAVASVAQHRDEDARLLTRETGKILHESVVDSLVFEARWNLALTLADDVDLIEQLPGDGHSPSTDISYSPLGVVTIIVPFNWPLAILAASLPAALLAGNTVIVKPPASAPLATAALVSRVAASLPPGVLGVVTGRDADLSPLITDPRIAKVCFTGSVAGGSQIMRLAADSLTRVTLELGGNDAALILDDAVLDEAHIDALFHAIFDSTGQICMNVKRVMVHRSRREELVSALESKCAQIVLGHGLDPHTTHGPVHTASAAARQHALLDEARALGAEVREFAEIPDQAALPGHFVRPALVLDAPASARIVTEEQFGPIIPILTFDTDEEAIALANDTWAGLCGSVWSADTGRARRIAAQLEVGYVWLNSHGAAGLDLRAPFGGVKGSGFGREQGIHGLRDFMDTRAVSGA